MEERLFLAHLREPKGSCVVGSAMPNFGGKAVILENAVHIPLHDSEGKVEYGSVLKEAMKQEKKGTLAIPNEAILSLADVTENILLERPQYQNHKNSMEQIPIWLEKERIVLVVYNSCDSRCLMGKTSQHLDLTTSLYMQHAREVLIGSPQKVLFDYGQSSMLQVVRNTTIVPITAVHSVYDFRNAQHEKLPLITGRMLDEFDEWREDQLDASGYRDFHTRGQNER